MANDKVVFTTAVVDPSEAPCMCGNCGESDAIVGHECPFCGDPVLEDEGVDIVCVPTGKSHEHYHKKCWMLRDAEVVTAKVYFPPQGKFVFVKVGESDETLEVAYKELAKFLDGVAKKEG